MPDDLRDLLAALPVGAELQLTTTRDEYGRTITIARTGSRTETLNHDVGLRIGAVVEQQRRRL